MENHRLPDRLLGVDNNPVEVTYLKFDLSTSSGRTLQSATLGAVVGTLSRTATNTNTNYDVPLTVSGMLGQQLALGIDSSSSDGLDLNSKEANSGTYAPKLVLTLAK